MKQRYLKYYEQYKIGGMLRFIWDGLRTQESRRRLSLMNRQRDYKNLAGNPELLSLHREMNEQLYAATREWESYDYGEGYFYQGFGRIGVTGLRDTDARVQAMGLSRLVAGKSVLEIGCNTGFVSLSIAETAEHVIGFDLNPHLINIARAAAKHLNCKNVEFNVISFEDYARETLFDVVLSFANHSTYDGNTRQSIGDFFERTHALTAPHGILLFESHPPEHEGSGLDEVCAVLGDLYEIEERKVLTYGTFLDTERTFIIARKAG